MSTEIRPRASVNDGRASTRNPPVGSPWWASRRRPVGTAVVLAVAPVTVTIAVGLVPGPMLGDATQLTRRLIAVLVVAAAALLVVGRPGAWRRTGAAGAATWRDVGVLAVPTAVALAPALTGFAIPATGMLAVLVVGYAATGVFEELWHRGVILDTLRPVGMRRAAVVGGALFAASHLGNIAFGQPVMVSLAQSVGAFCFGIGFSVFRWRTDAVWLLVAIHGIGDLMFKITALHGSALWAFLVGHDIAMLLWGLWCLRGLTDRSDDGSAPPAPDAGAGRTS